MPGSMSDGEREFRRHDRSLRSDAAGPEHRYVARLEFHSVAEVGTAQVGDAEFGWIADVDGCTVNRGHTRGDGARLFDLVCGDGTHRHHGRPADPPGGSAFAICDVHRDVSVLL